MQGNILYIADNGMVDIPKDAQVVFFNEDSDEYLNRLNIIDIFNKKQEELRKKLLFFNRQVFEKIIPLLDRDEDYNYLLTSLFFEKSPYKTDYIYIFYKLNIIIDYIKSNNINKICLNINQLNIVKFFDKFAKQNDIYFENLRNNKEEKNIKDIVMKSFSLSSLYFLKRETKKIFKKINKNKQVHSKLVVSYYPNYYFEEDEFISKYFGAVSKELNKNYDWLFIYADDINKIGKEQSRLKEHHFVSYNFLDSFISMSDMFQIVKESSRLYKKFKRINISQLFYFNNVDYYDILIDDWKKSISSILIDTMIFKKKFENFLKLYNHNEIVYLMEYQPWEDVLNKLARNHNICTKGVTHSVIRPNLMNYYHDTLVHKYMNTSNFIGSNSPLSDKIFEQNGFKGNQIKPIEAQRFNYLSKIEKVNTESSKNLLITTSIDYEETEELLKTFASAYKENIFNKIFIKPHPDLDVVNIIKSIDDFPEYEIIGGNMNDAFAIVNTVFTANSSSVLLESLLNNKNTITLFSLKTLPMPAVKDHELLNIATSIKSLEKILNSLKFENKHINQKEMLFLNQKLNMWNSFLGLK